MNIDFLKLISSKKAVIGFIAACTLVGGSVAIATAANGSIPSHASSEASESESESESSHSESAEASRDASAESREDGGKWSNGMPASASAAGAPMPGDGSAFGQWVAGQHRRNADAPNGAAKGQNKPAATATETAG